LELPFGHFYKTQISPFFKDELKNLWPWGKPERDVYFTFNEPYFFERIKSFEEKQKVRLFLKYTNDNNPFQQATIKPQTVVDGLAKIGGYFALFGVLNMVLFLYNEYSF
jgi:hypothetical protein